MRFFNGGPSILSGAVWTQWRAWKSGYSDSALCTRCHEEDESLMHRYWRCPGNGIFYDWLTQQLGDYALDISTLPRSLLCHGLAPAGGDIPAKVIVAVQHYLLMVNRHASAHRNASSRQRQLPEPHVCMEDIHTAYVRLRQLAIKPVVKGAGVMPDCINQVAAAADSVVENVSVFYDGSYTQDTEEQSAKAGFGVVIVRPDGTSSEYYGPVITNCAHPHFRGAAQYTNNSAELSGCCWSLELLASQPAGTYTIGYDSEYSRQVACGNWHSRRNARLAAQCRAWYRRILHSHTLVWRHIDSHTGHIHNEKADMLADLGADGYTRLPTTEEDAERS